VNRFNRAPVVSPLINLRCPVPTHVPERLRYQIGGGYERNKYWKGDDDKTHLYQSSFSFDKTPTNQSTPPPSHKHVRRQNNDGDWGMELVPEHSRSFSFFSSTRRLAARGGVRHGLGG